MKSHLLGALLLLPLIVLADSTKTAEDKPVQATALARAYDKDPNHADALYKGHKITISGTVKQIEASRRSVIALKVPNDLDHVGGLACIFGSSEGFAKLKVGDHVTINGVVNGKDAITIIVTDCLLR